MVANRISKGFEGVFRVLPLVTVVDNSVLICHGGVSDITDLQYINEIPRHKVCLSHTCVVTCPIFDV